MELEDIFPGEVREALRKTTWKDGIEEIRARVGQPLEFVYGNECRYWDVRKKEMVSQEQWRQKRQMMQPMSAADLNEMLNYICNYSLYAFQQEIRQGYLTMEGGHRVGLAGQTVVSDGKIDGISLITFLNIRVARERKGCAKEILPFLRRGQSIYNTLLVSAPGVGKTTYLRDCIRMLSMGETLFGGLKVCVVDERSEIAACHLGIPQNDLGPRTDVLEGCGKEEGMQLLLRTMSPQVIAVDELGEERDFAAVERAVFSGSQVLGTIHAGEIRELWEKPYLRNWLQKKIIKRFVFLKKKDTGERQIEIYDENLERLC